WKAGQHVPECQAAAFVREPDINALARQHVVEAGAEIVRDREPGVSPVIRTKGQVIDRPLGQVKWEDRQRDLVAIDARESADVLGERSLRFQRPICSALEERGSRAPQGQYLSSQVKLDPPVLAAFEKAQREPGQILGAFDLFLEIVEQP